MSTTIEYKGSTLTTVSNETKKLDTAGTWLEDDIIITDSSSGGSVLVVDTLDSHGGTVRTITAQNTVTLMANKNITPTSSSQVVTPDQGYDGFAQVTVAAGSSSGQTATGTFTGDNGITVQIQCSFAPDVIYIYGDLSEDLTNRGVNSITIVKDTSIYISNDTSTSASSTSITYYASDITGYNESDSTSPHAIYSSGVLTIDMVNNTSSNRFVSGITYSYELSTLGSGGSTPSATAHTIYFEFSDSTDATINAWYDDSFISDAITATTPTTYGQKTVTLAQLDGVTWYEYDPSETWETLLDSNIFVNAGTPYGNMWISDLGSVSITVGSVWRITLDGVAYTMTATANGVYASPYNTIIGNPAYVGGTNDGTTAPICLEQNPWGAWTGGTAASITQDIGHDLKVERLVTS